MLATLVTRISVYSLYLETNVIPNISPYIKAVFKGKYLYVLCFVLINKESFIAFFELAVSVDSVARVDSAIHK